MTREETPLDDRIQHVRTRLANLAYRVERLRTLRDELEREYQIVNADLDALYVDTEVELDVRKEGKQVDVLAALELERSGMTARGLELFKDRVREELASTLSPAISFAPWATTLGLLRGFVDTLGTRIAELVLEAEEDGRPIVDDDPDDR